MPDDIETRAISWTLSDARAPVLQSHQISKADSVSLHSRRCSQLQSHVASRHGCWIASLAFTICIRRIFDDYWRDPAVFYIAAHHDVSRQSYLHRQTAIVLVSTQLNRQCIDTTITGISILD